VSSDAELLEELSAYLDGELDAAERADVESLLGRSPRAREELTELAAVRSTLRGLPAVEPPFGFYERMLLDGTPAGGRDRAPAAASSTPGATPSSRRRPRPYAAWAGGAAAAAAVTVVLLGAVSEPVQPAAADPVAPPVERYLARHDEVSTTASPDAAEGDGFESFADAELAAMPDPYEAPEALGDGFRRTAAYHSDGRIMHFVYQQGDDAVSVYAQVGTPDWDAMPEQGSAVQLGDEDAWKMITGQDEVMVMRRGIVVYTVVGSVPEPEMVEVMQDLPDAEGDQSLPDRAQATAREVVVRFGLGG
jgi:negative regulator of sigma E activity